MMFYWDSYGFNGIKMFRWGVHLPHGVYRNGGSSQSESSESERKSQRRESQRQKKEDQSAQKGGSGGSKCRLAKAAGAEPAGQMRDEKVHAVVARSTFGSQNVQNTRGSDHFWRFRC